MIKGAAGAAVLAIGGYFGAAFMQVISAPKDSVAYDLIQSMTGMLKPQPAPTAAPPPAASAAKASDERTRVAPMPSKMDLEAPPFGGAAGAPSPAALPQAAPATPSLPSPPTLSARAAAPTTQATSTTEPSAPEPAPPGSILDRVQKTTQLAKQAMASASALANSRVLTLSDRATSPICGVTYALEVSSVAPGAGRVALTGPDGAALSLAVGEPPRSMSDRCRVVLISTMEDLTERRAQLREIVVR